MPSQHYLYSLFFSPAFHIPFISHCFHPFRVTSLNRLCLPQHERAYTPDSEIYARLYRHTNISHPLSKSPSYLDARRLRATGLRSASSLPLSNCSSSCPSSPRTPNAQTKGNANALTDCTIRSFVSPASTSAESQVSRYLDRQVLSKYKHCLPAWANNASLPRGAKLVSHMFCVTPAWLGTVLTHALPELGYTELARDVFSCTIYYVSGVLAFMSGTHVGLGFSNLGVLERDHKAVWNLGRMGCALIPLTVSILSAAASHVSPHDAIFGLATGFLFIQVMDLFSHKYSLTPRWFANHRLIAISSIIASLLVLVTSELQVYVGRPIRLDRV